MQYFKIDKPYLALIKANHIGEALSRYPAEIEKRKQIITCGEAIPEGSQVCWQCKSKISKCNVCRNKDKNICLVCEHWRYKSYETKKVH